MLTFFSFPAFAEDGLWQDIKSDYDEFYSSDRFMRMGVMFAGAAVLANTDMDQKFQDQYAGTSFQSMILSAQTYLFRGPTVLTGNSVAYCYITSK